MFPTLRRSLAAKVFSQTVSSLRLRSPNNLVSLHTKQRSFLSVAVSLFVRKDILGRKPIAKRGVRTKRRQQPLLRSPMHLFEYYKLLKILRLGISIQVRVKLKTNSWTLPFPAAERRSCVIQCCSKLHYSLASSTQ